ncbi:MAG: response regulator [Candidatus Aegiribacteria sp.]|nr:response regulator [Candidatus Aegiribacteria sp.]
MEQIVNAGEKARDLVRQLLAFSRKQKLEFSDVDLNELVRNFQKLLRRTIRENIAIDLSLMEGLTCIRGDVGQLEQVLMNLAVNAQDAMPDGGKLMIRTDIAESKAPGDGNQVLLEVSDSGAGIDDETLEHIFEPFFTTKSKDRGTGLGLSTVFGVINQHGGSISVTSAVGEGTTFRITIPALQISGSSPQEKKFSEPSEGGNETVLLVEDDPLVRTLARRILSRVGYEVIEADSGEQALRRIVGNEGIDLLITDVIMPDMDGPALFSELSEMIPDLKVLYMSGYTSDVLKEHNLDCQGANFIQKPFTFKTLTRTVRKLLDLS